MSKVIIIISLFFCTKSFCQTIYQTGSNRDSLTISLQKEELEIIHSKNKQSIKNSEGKIEIERCSRFQKIITFINKEDQHFQMFIGKQNFLVFDLDTVEFSSSVTYGNQTLKSDNNAEFYDTIYVPIEVMRNSFIRFRYYNNQLTSIVVFVNSSIIEFELFRNRRNFVYLTSLNLSTYNERVNFDYSQKRIDYTFIFSRKNNDGANVKFRNTGNPKAVYIHRNIGRDSYILKRVLHFNIFKKVNHETIILQGDAKFP